jgi:hypothetical protein
MKHVDESRTDRPNLRKNNYADEIKKDFWMYKFYS